MKLGEIANVSIGILTKRECDERGKNEYALFSLKNYEENNQYEIVRSDKELEDKLSKEDDLLFRLIYPNKIITVTKEISNLLIPSQLCIIRPDKNLIKSNVLKWYLESEEGKKQILAEVTGTTIQSVSVSALRKIEIPDISKEKQEIISKLIELSDREKQIEKQILEKKEKLYEAFIENLIESEEKIIGK